MAAVDPRSILAGTGELQARARADRGNPASVPLIVFGLLTLGGALLVVPFSFWFMPHVYWVAAGPIGLWAVSVWNRRRRLRTGVGTGPTSYGRAALALLGLFVFLPLVWLAPEAAIAAVLLYIAFRQRSLYLGVCAVAFGVLGTLEDYVVFSNLIGKVYDASWLSAAVYGTLGGLLVLAGLVAAPEAPLKAPDQTEREAR
jgi:hypothetical protein